MGGEDLGDIFGVGWFMRILRGGICWLRWKLGEVRGICAAVHAVERSNGHAGQSVRLACPVGNCKCKFNVAINIRGAAQTDLY